MSNSVFKHERSNRNEAIKNAFVSVAVIVISLLSLQLLPNIKPEEMLLIYGVLLIVFVGIWSFFVIPNWTRKGNLEYLINQEKVKCVLPDGDGYVMEISDIESVVKIRSMSMDYYVDYWIISKSGEDRLIPSGYGLSPKAVLQALKKVNPNLEVKKQTNY